MKTFNTVRKYARLGFTIGFRILFKHIFYFKPRLKHKDEYTFEQRYKMVRDFAIFMVHHMRPEFRIENIELLRDSDKPALIVCNHQSIFDILTILVNSPRPVQFVGKSELKGKPFIGVWFEMLNGLYLNRDDVRQAVSVIKESTATLEKGYSVAIFPEGTRNKDPMNVDALDFHAGSFKPAYRAKVDVLSISMFGTFRPLGGGYEARSFPIHGKIERIPYDSFAEKKTADFALEVQKKTEENVRSFRELDADYYAKKLHKKYPKNKFWKKRK